MQQNFKIPLNVDRLRPGIQSKNLLFWLWYLIFRQGLCLQPYVSFMKISSVYYKGHADSKIWLRIPNFELWTWAFSYQGKLPSWRISKSTACWSFGPNKYFLQWILLLWPWRVMFTPESWANNSVSSRFTNVLTHFKILNACR